MAVIVPPGTEGDCTAWSYDCTFTGGWTTTKSHISLVPFRQPGAGPGSAAGRVARCAGASLHKCRLQLHRPLEARARPPARPTAPALQPHPWSASGSTFWYHTCDACVALHMRCLRAGCPPLGQPMAWRAGAGLGLVISVQCCIVVYAAVYLLIIRRSFQVLEGLPYKQFRIANFMVRLQVGNGRAGGRAGGSRQAGGQAGGQALGLGSLPRPAGPSGGFCSVASRGSQQRSATTTTTTTTTTTSSSTATDRHRLTCSPPRCLPPCPAPGTPSGRSGCACWPSSSSSSAPQSSSSCASAPAPHLSPPGGHETQLISALFTRVEQQNKQNECTQVASPTSQLRLSNPAL